MNCKALPWSGRLHTPCLLLAPKDELRYSLMFLKSLMEIKLVVVLLAREALSARTARGS